MPVAGIASIELREGAKASPGAVAEGRSMETDLQQAIPQQPAAKGGGATAALR